MAIAARETWISSLTQYHSFIETSTWCECVSRGMVSMCIAFALKHTKNARQYIHFVLAISTAKYYMLSQDKIENMLENVPSSSFSMFHQSFFATHSLIPTNMKITN